MHLAPRRKPIAPAGSGLLRYFVAQLRHGRAHRRGFRSTRFERRRRAAFNQRWRRAQRRRRARALASKYLPRRFDGRVAAEWTPAPCRTDRLVVGERHVAPAGAPQQQPSVVPSPGETPLRVRRATGGSELESRVAAGNRPDSARAGSQWLCRSRRPSSTRAARRSSSTPVRCVAMPTVHTPPQ